MMAESRTSALATTTSYVSFDIMPAARPVLGFTTQRRVRLEKQASRKKQTIIVQVSDYMRKVFLRFFVQVGYGNACGEDSIVRMLGR